ncbi:potassium channel family protein [Nocardia blacklockiae]|uniref:potassium channel family protein n=1 Tax=Nocardia blacklockiae TaxID=480036 RepID=UPI001893CA58|nr:potassium channel family protein [Nocardia blacklockiae]MBF6171363.1 two pore domain potassium channel family protein [Nocardia blacklockiae]
MTQTNVRTDSVPADPPNAEPVSRRVTWERATNIPMGVLAAVFLGVYAWHVLDTGASPVLDAWLTGVDIAIWTIFAADFLIRLGLSTRRWRFLRSHPLELLIVLLPPVRPLRLLRAALLVLDTLNRSRLTRARLSVFVGVSSLLVVFLCSLAMFDAEFGAPDAKVQNFGDALWWAVVSVTTVGYGDYYPVTVEGRLVALILMTFGIGLISFAIGTTTSWVIDQLKTVEETAERTDLELGRLVDEIRSLRAEVAALSKASGAR